MQLINKNNIKYLMSIFILITICYIIYMINQNSLIFYFNSSNLIKIKTNFIKNSTKTLFWLNFNEENLLDYLDSMELDIKVFIYPLPFGILQLQSYETCNLPTHFQWEYQFIRYLQQYKNHILVNDPTIANIFLIQHQFLGLVAELHCNESIFINHMKPIITSIIHDYPYYNRSKGNDHYMLNLYDHGLWCELQCDIHGDYLDIFLPISNIRSIGNYGMDEYSNEQRISYFDLPRQHSCHHPQHDIVIPQPIDVNESQLIQYEGVSLRPYDSTFSGSIWGKRIPLRQMANTSINDYQLKHVELFKSSIDDPLSEFLIDPDMELVHEGYFMYHVTGLAEWSQRLYNAIVYNTIPIIISDGSIQAFEKFIDWRKFSMKISYKTWFNETLRTNFRRMIRYECDLYRLRVLECMNILNISTNTIILINQTKSCPKLQETIIFKKVYYLQQVRPWFHMNRNMKLMNTTRDANRLILLELWCQLSSNIHKDICIPSHHIARLEYF